MSRLLVLQSASDAQAATPWLARCLASVRDWAQGVGADYAFHGDAALALAPDWYRDKAGAKIPVVTDLVRLLLIEEALTGAYDAALWLDADFLLAAPDRFRPVDAPGGFAVGREVWVDADPKRPDRLKTWRGPHNACLMVRRGDADSMICGTFGQYSWHLNYIRQVLETGGLSPAGALSLIILDEGPLFIADTHVSFESDGATLARTVKAAARHVRRFGIEPRIALCSRSQFGNFDCRSGMAMREALAILDAKGVGFEYEGEMHTELALNPELRERLLQIIEDRKAKRIDAAQQLLLFQPAIQVHDAVGGGTHSVI